MAFDSFRAFLNRLDAAGELRRINQPVATELEITELADREMKKPGGGQALLLEKPTVKGEVSPFPLAINTLGSHRRMAMSLGADSIESVAAELGSLVNAKPPTSFREALSLLGTALDLRHAKPKVVKEGPCKEVKHIFEAPPTRTEPWPKAPEILKVGQASRLSSGSAQSEDRRDACPTLLNLPIQQCWPLDGGRFITLPGVVTRDPDTGERNVGMYRMQVYDERTTGMHWQLQKVGARHGRRYYETGTRMPVAVYLGGDPAFTFCATAPLPDGLDEFMLAATSARRQPSSSDARPMTWKCRPALISFWRDTLIPRSRCARKGLLAITRAITHCPTFIQSFISPPLLIAKTPFILQRLSACHRWKTSTSAALP